MDNSLFEKYKKTLHTRDLQKEMIIKKIQEVTGVSLPEESVEIKKKTVTLNLSSVQKNKLHTHNIKQLCAEIGFSLSY